MKKRARNAKQGRDGVIAVEQACNRLDLIWRNLLEEDVGVDGTIEIALGEFPTGKIVGAQVKSGASYIRSETTSSFRFYPGKDDLAYWEELSIPLRSTSSGSMSHSRNGHLHRSWEAVASA